MPGKTRARAAAGSKGRICIMLPRFSLYGGVEQFGFRLADGLAGRGYAVDFICGRQEAAPPKGVRVRAVGRPRGPGALKLLWFLWRAEVLRRRGGYDLSISLGKTWGQDVSRMGGGPLRVFWEKSERALPEGLPRRLKQLRRRLSPANLITLAVERRQFTNGSRVIAVSHLVRGWLLGAYPELDPEKVEVIYNWPDESRFSPPTPEERREARGELLRFAGLPEPDGPEGDGAGADGGADAPVFIGTASTNFRLKGVEPLIRALKLLPENTLLFVAGGRDSAAYAAVAEELGLSERVVFLGRVDDMPAFYRALDIFILPTYYDACSNAVLEALASGCRVITAKDNGAAFFLEEAAVLKDPGNVEDMAERLRLFMHSPPPPAFDWPLDVQSGLGAFMDYIETQVAAKRAGPAQAPARGCPPPA